MKRVRWVVSVVLSLLCAASVALAGWVVEPQYMMTNKMFFLMDCSGSMRGEHWTKAFAFVEHTITYSSDDARFALLTFGASDANYRWPGVPEPDAKPPVPEGWAQLPSDTAVRQATAWLSNKLSASSTCVIPGLRLALAEPVKDLTVVLVSDGIFDEPHDAVVRAVEEGQRRRERDGHGRAVIICYGVQRNASNFPMERIGRDFGGGYYLDTSLPPPPPPVPTHPFCPLPPPIQGTVR